MRTDCGRSKKNKARTIEGSDRSCVHRAPKRARVGAEWSWGGGEEMNWGENAIDGERGSVHKKRMREGRWRRERGAVGEASLATVTWGQRTLHPCRPGRAPEHGRPGSQPPLCPGAAPLILSHAPLAVDTPTRTVQIPPLSAGTRVTPGCEKFVILIRASLASGNIGSWMRNRWMNMRIIVSPSVPIII